MSFSDSQTVELRALDPPEFGSQCTICGAWKGQLPWQIEMGGSWGPICGNCGKRLLARVLRRKLPKSFSESQFVDAVCSFGVNRKEAQLMFGDFMKDWHEESSEVIEPLVKLKPRHVFRRKTAEEIFGQCVKLSREIRSRTEFSRTRRPDEPIRARYQGER